MENNLLKDLQKATADFSSDGKIKKLDLLQHFARQDKWKTKELVTYHQILLFLLSYPQNSEILSAASSEMRRISEMTGRQKNLRDKLINSGIAGTRTESAFSLTLTKWMCNTFPESVSFHSLDESGVHPKEIFKFALDEMEFELASDEKLKPEAWLQKVAGIKDNKKILHWIVNAFDNIGADDLIKDQLFESLKLFIQIDPADLFFSSSFGKVKTKKVFFHEEPLLKKFSEKEWISKKLPPEEKLELDERKEIISVARIALILLHRETDPITYCEENNLKYFELGRGLTIALFSIDSKRRLPLESYIGFMMFKNGYPMSYGGAWLFGKRALIGINIFESFRGGESALVFANLLRTYKMAFGASYFEVEPYQFGKNNPEGIRSGAFWFYHRFGFRSLDKKLFELGETEHEKIIADKTYRTPFDILKKFTGSNLFAHFGREISAPVNPAHISLFISRKITKDFNGDRKKAFGAAVQALKRSHIAPGKSPGLSKLALFFAFCLCHEKFLRVEKELAWRMIDAKAEDEFEYIRLCASFLFEKKLSKEFSDFLARKYRNLR